MIYLASQSPRRAELLRQIGVEFSIHAVDCDESRQPGETAPDYVRRIAENKARRALEEITAIEPAPLVIAADTTISLDGDIIGKPADRRQCRCILDHLSGREHQVMTAVALATRDRLDLRLSENRVWFRALEQHEIEAYCDDPEPMDKAGAYAIQGKAAIFVSRLEGSYSSVMGLPLFETAELLRSADVQLIRKRV